MLMRLSILELKYLDLGTLALKSIQKEAILISIISHLLLKEILKLKFTLV